MERRDFFVSYNKDNREWAEWVVRVLKKNGYSAYSQLDIKPGDNFIEKMNEFLRNSDGFIAVWSKTYSESRFCMTEMQAAFSEWHKKRMECFLIVCVDKHPVEPLYSALVHVDLPDKSAASETTLADAVRRAVPRPAPEPEPPTPEKSPDSPTPKPIKSKAQKSVRTGVVIVAFFLVIAFLLCLLRDYDANQFALMGSVNHAEGDYSEARKYYEQAAEKGSGNALYNLGLLYYDGLGVERDYAKARDYYEQAAAKGNKTSPYYNLGWMYEHGEGVNIDYEMALYYYQKAADAGHEDAPAKAEAMREKLNAQSGE